MSRKSEAEISKIVTVIFVEGDADEIIVRMLLDYYRQKGWVCDGDLEVKNAGGFPDLKKMSARLTQIEQNNAKRYRIVFKAICCEYDTDIFEKEIQTKPDWKSVEANLKKKHDVAAFCRVEAKTSIENWMLDDAAGLLNALSLPADTNITGHDGQDKISRLFKKKGIMYDKYKGMNKIKPYIEKLNIEKIRNARAAELRDFEKVIGVGKYFD